MNKKIIAVALLSVVLSACNKPPENIGEFPDYINRSAEFIRPGPGGEFVYWTKEGSIIYVKEQLGDETVFPKKEYFLREWNLVDTPITLREEQVAFSCYDGSSQLTQTTKGKFFSSSYSNPKEIDGNSFLSDAKNKKLSFNPNTCSFEKGLEKISNDYYLNLGDFGVVEIKWKPKNPIAILISPENKKIAKLNEFPITSKKIEFIGFLDRYLIVDFPNLKYANLKWRNEGCLKAYLLSREGEYSSFCIPTGPWTGGDVSIEISNNGILIASEGPEAALYWIKDDMYQKIVSGSIRNMKASYDGCSIAAVHQFDTSREGWKKPGELIEFNICKFNLE